MGKEFRVTVATPCKNNGWQAITEEKLITAENLNDIIAEALPDNQYKVGARIISIEEAERREKKADALLKATAKKPVKDDDSKMMCCPSCGMGFGFKTPHYCDICGQKLDWTDYWR